MPVTRSIFNPRLETSITQVSQPSCAIWYKSRCRSQLSGVVCARSWRCPDQHAPLVPSSPTRRPAAVSVAAARCAVTVLPLVPVIPIIVIRRAGSPYSRTESHAIARRAFATRMTATSGGRRSGRSHTTATAPCATACSAKSAPSRCCPDRQTNSAPAVTARESQQMQSTSASVLPRSEIRSSPWSN